MGKRGNMCGVSASSGMDVSMGVGWCNVDSRMFEGAMLVEPK